jgi:uncharacterized protein (TIGR00369 family)
VAETTATPSSVFQAVLDGRIAAPECARTLGLAIVGHDAATRTVTVTFEGRAHFTNPIGNIQGGFLAAMLDDTMGLAVASTLEVGQFAPTLNLAVQFHRPAQVGALRAIGTVVNRGSQVCQLRGELFQNDRLVASATATAIVRLS